MHIEARLSFVHLAHVNASFSLHFPYQRQYLHPLRNIFAGKKGHVPTFKMQQYLIPHIFPELEAIGLLHCLINAKDVWIRR